MTVLIVDDHAGFRATARSLLESEGYEVLGEAADGNAACAFAAQARPDIVLLDVQLPDMDGFEVAERLRFDGYNPSVILTSSRDAAEFGGLIARSTARGFIPKDELSGARLAALLE